MRSLRLFPALICLLLAAACASTSHPGSTGTPAEARAYGDFMIARFAAMTNDPAAASRHYASALSTAPEGASVAERAVFSALLANDYALAAGMARRASDTGNESGLVRLTLAIDSIGRGRNRQAIDLIEASDFRAFNRMMGRNLSAWAMFGEKDVAGAEAVLMSNLTGEPRLDSATLHMLGFMQASAGEDAKAAETFAALWETGARLAVGAEAYARLLATRGDSEAAINVLDAFRKDVGQNAALEALKADILAGKATPPRRLTAREGAALAVYLPASALMFQSSDDVSAVYFVLALALDPEMQAARALLGQALIQSAREGEAIRVLRAVPESSPYYATARGQLARALMLTGQPEEALKVAGEALAAKPERALQLQLANLYSSQDQYDEAEAVLDDILSADAAAGREDWQAVFMRGAARERLNKWDDAEADLSRALELSPDNATVLNYLGYSWIDRGIRLEEGFDLIRRAVELEPRSGHIIDSLGWAHYKLGQYEEAVDYLERAVELLPGDPVLNDHLGDAYWQVGRRKEAGFQWRRALKLDPSAEERAKIEEKLMGGIPVEPPEPGNSAAP